MNTALFLVFNNITEDPGLNSDIINLFSHNKPIIANLLLFQSSIEYLS